MNTMRISTRSAIQLALWAASLGVLVCLWVAWCEFPNFAWNDVRLAPAFALRHGINPYPPLGGGPLFTWIYGPVGLLINLPATFAPTPLAALRGASLINAVVLIVPFAVIFFGSMELRMKEPAVRWLALALGVLLLARSNLLFQVADHTAVAFGLLSCWCLARAPVPSAMRLAVAGALCALAIWSKQIEVFLLLAQFAYLLIAGQRGAAMRYLGWVAGFGLLGLCLAGWAFGFGNLWLNLVTVPGRLPWSDIWPRLAMRPGPLVTEVVVPAVGLMALWRWQRWPDRSRESGRFFQVATLAYLAMLPVGMAAYLKIGGDTNLLHSWHYLLPGCLWVWLATEQITFFAAGRVIAVTALALALRWTDFTSLPIRPAADRYAVAARLTEAYPQALWFPQNPVITFYADGRLWHSEDGIATRNFAGYGLREPDFRRHLPARLQGVVYPSTIDFPFAMSLLPEFNQTIRFRFWKLFTLTPAQP